jgi:hypothetical protein
MGEKKKPHGRCPCKNKKVLTVCKYVTGKNCFGIYGDENITLDCIMVHGELNCVTCVVLWC